MHIKYEDFLLPDPNFIYLDIIHLALLCHHIKNSSSKDAISVIGPIKSKIWLSPMPYAKLSHGRSHSNRQAASIFRALPNNTIDHPSRGCHDHSVCHFHHISVMLGYILSRPAKYMYEEVTSDTHNLSSCHDISDLLPALHPCRTSMRHQANMCQNITTRKMFRTRSIMRDRHRSTRSSRLLYFAIVKVLSNKSILN